VRTIDRRGRWAIKKVPAERLVLEHDERGVIMSNDPHEMLSIGAATTRAHNHTVVAGLGLGLVVDALLKTPAVSLITVIESHRDIIEMVGGKYIGVERVSIVLGDARTMDPKWIDPPPDYVYLDIWDDDSGDTYRDRVAVRERWKKVCINVDVWAHDRAMNNWKMKGR